MLYSSWNVIAHGDSWEGKWRGNWRMEWVASTLHNTSEHGVSSITTTDAHTSAASSRLNWRPRQFKRTRPFRRKTKSSFCACAIYTTSPSTPLFLSQAHKNSLSGNQASIYNQWRIIQCKPGSIAQTVRVIQTQTLLQDYIKSAT